MKIVKSYNDITRDLARTISEIQSGNYNLSHNTFLVLEKYINELLQTDKRVSKGAKESYKKDFCYLMEFLRTNGLSHLISKTNAIKLLKHIKSVHVGFSENEYNSWNHNTFSDTVSNFYQNLKSWNHRIKWIVLGVSALFLIYSGQITNAFDFLSYIK